MLQGKGDRTMAPNPTGSANLKRGALGKVITALAEHLEAPGTPQELAPVRNGHRCLTNRTDCPDYVPSAAREGQLSNV